MVSEWCLWGLVLPHANLGLKAGLTSCPPAASPALSPPHGCVPLSLAPEKPPRVPQVNQSIELLQVKNNPSNPYSFSHLFWGGYFYLESVLEGCFTPMHCLVGMRWCKLCNTLTCSQDRGEGGNINGSVFRKNTREYSLRNKRCELGSVSCQKRSLIREAKLPVPADNQPNPYRDRYRAIHI